MGNLGAGTAFSSFATGPVTSGVSDGNAPSGVGMPSTSGSNAWVVGAIIIGALVLLILGVIGLRASGEIVI